MALKIIGQRAFLTTQETERALVLAALSQLQDA